jgi:hypothetical protein
MSFLVTLAVVYGAGLVWNFVRSGGATWGFEWPVRVAVQAWNKVFGADKKED